MNATDVVRVVVGVLLGGLGLLIGIITFMAAVEMMLEVAP